MSTEFNDVFSYLFDDAKSNLDENLLILTLDKMGKPISVTENKEPLYDYGDTPFEAWATASEALANGAYGDKVFALYKIKNELKDLKEALDGGEDSKKFGVETNPYKMIKNVLKEASEPIKGLNEKVGGIGNNTPTLNGGYPDEYTSSKEFDPISTIDSLNTVDNEEDEEKKEEVYYYEDVDIESSYTFESDENNVMATDLSEDENVDIESSYTCENNSGYDYSGGLE